MDDCVFCRILSGDLPAHFVYQDELVAAFLSLEQPNPYKVLVVPRHHVETVYDLKDAQAAAIFQATVKISRAVRDASGCEGLNLVQSNGKAGQQDVFHFHLHIVPRFYTGRFRRKVLKTPLGLRNSFRNIRSAPSTPAPIAAPNRPLNRWPSG
ncbi:MAG: HIT domain-containing protein [Anaerolineales bacterium]